MIKHISITALAVIMMLASFFVHGAGASDTERRDEVVGLFGTLLTPSMFTPASCESIGLTVYGRTLTAEGKVPDFDGDVEDTIDELTMFAGARLGGLGLTVGFSQGSEFEFSQPFIVSADYKIGLLGKRSPASAAIDVQYSMIILPEEENIEVSALGFGVASVTGLAGVRLLSRLEPYVGLTLNYVYLKPDREDLIGVIKLVPRLGLQVSPIPLISVGTEIKLIENSYLESAWMWDVGVCLRF